MSTECIFSYSVPSDGYGEIISNVFEVGETSTQYLNWIMELMPEDYERVDAFAPFLSQIYEALAKNTYWGDFGTLPFEPEQANLWATRWKELWQTETGDEEIEGVKQNWQADTKNIFRDLEAVVRQAECAKRHGVLLEFFIG